MPERMRFYPKPGKNFFEVSEDLWVASSRDWKVELGDGKEIRLALAIRLTDMAEATGEARFEEFPYVIEAMVVPWKIGPEFLAKANESGPNFDDPESLLPESKIQMAVEYGGGVVVTHVLIDEIAGGDSDLSKFGPEEILWFEEEHGWGSVAAQRGKGVKVKVPQFKDGDVAMKFAKELLERAQVLIGVMIGFVLDRPVNLLGNSGWSVIEEMAT